MPASPLSPLRRRRIESGLSQTELATRAGVSRQLVAAVEAGRNMPSVDAALRLAHALALSVEELFGASQAPTVAALDGVPAEGTAVRVGRVGDRLVSAPLADHGIAGASWAMADGVVEGNAVRLFDGARPAGVVLAGCDPAFGVAERMLEGLGARSLLAISAPTGVALRALGRGSIHAAVVHGPEHELPSPPVPVDRWHIARWTVGLAVAPSLRDPSLEAVLSRNVLVAQRDPAAASQQAFDRARSALGITGPLSGPSAAGHLDAARLAGTLSGAGVTNEPAAQALELNFVGLEHHVVELWVAQRWLEHPGLYALGEVLASAAFTQRIAQFGGYDLAGCGARLG